MKRTFIQASIWSVIWRILVFIIPLAILQIVLLLTAVGTYREPSILLDILFTAAYYAIVYYVTKNQINKQGLSWDAVKGKKDIQKKKSDN